MHARSRSGLAFVAGAVLVSAALARTASAQDIAHARRQYLEADFEQSAESFATVLDGSTLSRADAVEAHVYLAALRAVLGDPETAREHLLAAAALDPAVQSPEGAPDQVATWLEEARRVSGGRPAALEVTALETLRASRPAQVRAVLDPAPRLLVEQLELSCSMPDGTVRETRGSPPDVSFQVWVPVGVERLHCEAKGKTRGGAALFARIVDLPVEGGGQTAPSAPSTPEPSADAGKTQWWIWAAAGGSVLVAAVATILILSAGPDQASISSARVEGF